MQNEREDTTNAVIILTFFLESERKIKRVRKAISCEIAPSRYTLMSFHVRPFLAIFAANDD